MRCVLLLCVWLAPGCAYTLQITSDVPGARLQAQGEGVTSLPTEVRVPWGPWVRRPVTISAPEYRPVDLDLGFRTSRSADLSLFGLLTPWRSRTQGLRIVLVPEHGLSGTWSAQELGIVQ